MAYVRRRITKSGTLSTTLVESHRDAKGRPRQRLLANLHGADSTVAALGRLAVDRDRLRKERAKLEPELPHAKRFYEVVMTNMGMGHRYSTEELKEIDRLVKARKRLLKRVAEIDARLAEIAKEGAIIKKHCSASAEEIRAAANAYAEKLREKEAYALGLELALAGAKGNEEAFLKKFFQA